MVAAAERLLPSCASFARHSLCKAGTQPESLTTLRRIYCVYMATDAEVVRAHAAQVRARLDLSAGARSTK